MPTGQTTSTKQCANVKYNQKKAKKIACDSKFNPIKFAVHSEKFLMKLDF